MSFKTKLAEALQNLSGKELPDMDTTAGVLRAFNLLYTCVVTFALTPETAKVVVKQNGVSIAPEDDGTFALKEGSYTYSISADGYFSLVDQALVITNADETTGTKTVTKSLTKYCVVTFDTTPAGASITVYDSTSKKVDAEADGTYKLAEGSYTYNATADGYIGKTAQSLSITSSEVATGTKTVTVTLEVDAD